METVALAEEAAVSAEPSRAAMRLALPTGRARTVAELAGSAEVGPSTVRERISRLRAADVVPARGPVEAVPQQRSPSGLWHGNAQRGRHLARAAGRGEAA